MVIKKDLTLVNFNKGNNRKIQYIVIHFTGNDNDTSQANAYYFKSINRNSSAHYFVDENEIYQVVEDKDVAWSVGKDYSNGKAPYWNKCTNNNSISIEMCSAKSNNQFYIPQKTKDNTIQLVKDLMKKYNIPVENVIRHFDVAYKTCPEPFVRDYDQWKEFKSQLSDNEVENALNILANKGIIDSVDFWKVNYNTDDGKKYFKDFIIKVANYIK